MTQETRKPDLVITTKIANGRGDRIGARIGVAFKHTSGNGFNIILDAQPIPLDGQIHLIAFPIDEQN